MQRSGKELQGFLDAAKLLLDETAYLSWCHSRGEAVVPLQTRRELADFLAVVGGDGYHHGTLDAKLAEIGDGSGWVAPAATVRGQQARVWHPLRLRPEGLTPVCGGGKINWHKAQRLEDAQTVRFCHHLACQEALVQ